METYYLSLVRGLIGYYVKFKAPSSAAVSCHAATYFGKMWCSVYSEAYFLEVLRRKHGTVKTKVVNPYDPIYLNEEGEQL